MIPPELLEMFEQMHNEALKHGAIDSRLVPAMCFASQATDGGLKTRTRLMNEPIVEEHRKVRQ